MCVGLERGPNEWIQGVSCCVRRGYGHSRNKVLGRKTEEPDHKKGKSALNDAFRIHGLAVKLTINVRGFIKCVGGDFSTAILILVDLFLADLCFDCSVVVH